MDEITPDRVYNDAVRVFIHIIEGKETESPAAMRRAGERNDIQFFFAGSPPHGAFRLFGYCNLAASCCFNILPCSESETLSQIVHRTLPSFSFYCLGIVKFHKNHFNFTSSTFSLII